MTKSASRTPSSAPGTPTAASKQPPPTSSSPHPTSGVYAPPSPQASPGSPAATAAERGAAVPSPSLSGSVSLPPSRGSLSMSIGAMEAARGGGVLRGSRSEQLQDSYQATLLAPLDMRKVKAELQGEDGGLTARLLQALRWRLVHSRPGPDRWAVLASWVECDLLGCRVPVQGGQEGHTVLQVLSRKEDVLVLEELARLCNALASDRLGRSYLLQAPRRTLGTLFDMLVQAGHTAEAVSLQGVDGVGADGQPVALVRDTALVQQCLVALQKLSLKRVAQSTLIALGALPMLAGFMQDLDHLSEFTAEYGSALVMNLCLRSAGKVAAEACAPQLLQLCEGLVESRNEQIRTYVNGTLYSVFARPAICEAARARGMEELLMAVQVCRRGGGGGGVQVGAVGDGCSMVRWVDRRAVVRWVTKWACCIQA